MSYYFNKTISGNFDDVIIKVTDELKKEGFGILTEIDVKETLKKKLNVDFKKYKILGACNPPFAYEALKAEEFSSIEFRMINGKISSITGNEFNGTATGYLSIAGKTKEVNVPFSGNLLNDGQLDLEGKVNLKMSEFDIDPPKAMAGTLKTGDEVSIVYSLKLEKNNTGKQISETKAGSSIVN